MEQQKINLNKILEDKNDLAFEEGYSNYFTAAQRNIIFKAMEESIKQAIELAAENANIKHIRYGAYINGSYTTSEKFHEIPEYGDIDSHQFSINEQSILNTLEQIEYY